MKKVTFVIEHLEKEVWPWCKIEYENAGKLVRPEELILSNISSDENFGKNVKAIKSSIKEMKINWSKVCVLDPKAKEELKPEDRDKFDYFVFGGILGDAEFNGRTGEELTDKLPKEISLRHIGNRQFSTDNAVFVTKIILDGKKLSEIDMQEEAIIEIKDGEEVILPYCYPLVNGKPQISEKLIEYLKNKKDF